MSNNNKFIFIIILFVFITACCKMDENNDSYGSQFEYGNGTANSPYFISNKAHFTAIGSGYDTINKYYLLAADLVGENTITEPLGSKTGGFYGHFNGYRHTINLDIQGNYEYAGLFAQIGSGDLFERETYIGTVKNLKLTGTINVEGADVSAVGALAGAVASLGSRISSISSSVNITAEGINVSAVGGIAGALNQAVVEHCYSTGTITALRNDPRAIMAGGIAGSGSEAFIRFCWSSSNILMGNNTSTYIGGIISMAAKLVSDCVALNERIIGAPADENFIKIGYFQANRITEKRISSNDTILVNNYAVNSMIIDNGLNWGSDVESHDGDNVGTDKRQGASVSLEEVEAADGSWWKTTAGWSNYFGTQENIPWQWNDEIKRPVLWFE